MADCYHVWIFNSNNKGMVGAATIRRKCLSRNGANQNLKAKTSGTFAKIKPGMVLACMGDGCPCVMRGRGCDRATTTNTEIHDAAL
jgi:hypothetical protein